MLIPCIIIWSLLFGSSTSDIEQDKERCANKLVGAATCLPYVTGEANVPPIDCCTSFNQLTLNSPECICLLVKDKDDPSLGLKINTTRALGLPARCHSPVNLTVGDCPALLHLPPNSPDAKVFKDLANMANQTTTNTTATAQATGRRPSSTTPNASSDGGKIMSYLDSKMVSWLLVAVLAFNILPNLCCSTTSIY